MTLRQYYKKCKALSDKLYSKRSLSLQSNPTTYVCLSIFSADGEDVVTFTCYNSFSKTQNDAIWDSVERYVEREGLC